MGITWKEDIRLYKQENINKDYDKSQSFSN